MKKQLHVHVPAGEANAESAAKGKGNGRGQIEMEQILDRIKRGFSPPPIPTLLESSLSQAMNYRNLTEMIQLKRLA